MRLQSRQFAEKLFVGFRGAWFGPPVLVYRGETIDGSMRLDALVNMHASTADVPTVDVGDSKREAARALYYAGECDRCVELFGGDLCMAANTQEERDDLARTLMVDDASHLWPVLQGRARARSEHWRIVRGQQRQKRAGRAVRALAQLYWEAVETNTPIDERRARVLLEPWL